MAEPRSCFYDIERYLNYQIAPFKILIRLLFMGWALYAENDECTFTFWIWIDQSSFYLSLSLPLSFKLSLPLTFFLFLSLLSFSHSLTLTSSFFIPSLSYLFLSLFSPSHILTYSLSILPFFLLSFKFLPSFSLPLSLSCSEASRRSYCESKCDPADGAIGSNKNTAKGDC